MTILNLQVGAGADDAHEQQDDSSFSSSDVSAKSSSSTGTPWISGFRFTGVTVPSSAQITTAILQLRARSASFDDANFDIHAEDVDNAVNFSSNADVWNRVRTSASVAWIEDGVLSNTHDSSPDIAAVIQEIIGRPGWVSGNALVILCKGKTDIDKTFYADTYEEAPAQAAKLDITYIVDRKRSAARGMI